MKYIFLITFLFPTFSFAQSDVETKVELIARFKVEAELTLKSTPYRQVEHEKIKDYFIGLRDFSLELKENSKFNKRFNSYLSKNNLAIFCSDLLLNSKVLEEIISNCTRNRFFLCAEEVKEYSAFKQGLAAGLNQELLEEFNNTSECK